MITRTSLFVRRGVRDVEELRAALADILRAAIMIGGAYDEVDPRAHADKHAEIGPISHPSWLGFSCEGIYGEEAIPFAESVSRKLGEGVLVVVEIDEERNELVFFEDGVRTDPPAVVVDDILAPGDGRMLLAFRAKKEIHFAVGPPALVGLRKVFLEEVELEPSQFYRLRMTATSAGGEGRGVRIFAATSGLVVVAKAAWQSESALETGSDDEAAFVTRDDPGIRRIHGPEWVVNLPNARLRASRVDGETAWRWNDEAHGDVVRWSSSVVYFDVDLVAGRRTGRGVLAFRVEPYGGASLAAEVDFVIR